jgi:hypothetical protein
VKNDPALPPATNVTVYVTAFPEVVDDTVTSLGLTVGRLFRAVATRTSEAGKVSEPVSKNEIAGQRKENYNQITVRTHSIMKIMTLM